MNLPTTDTGLGSFSETDQEQNSNAFFAQSTTEQVKDAILTLAHQQSRILMLSPFDLFMVPEIKALNPSVAQATVALASARKDYRKELELI